MKFGKTEDWLNKKVDTARARVELTKPARPEITDPAEIEKKFDKAKKIFSRFIYIKARIKNKGDAILNISFEDMAATLELSNVPSLVAQQRMDEIVLSIPGMSKTETSYVISAPKLFYENCSPEGMKNRFIKSFSENPGAMFTYEHLAEKLNLSVSQISKIADELKGAGVILVRGMRMGDGQGVKVVQLK